MAHVFNDSNFDQEVLKSQLPVLVDFWATWCGPCQMQGPIVEKLATEFEGKVKIGKMDVDQANKTASQFRIMSIPTMIVFKNGQPVTQKVGFQSEANLREMLNELLK
ncbi:MAG: thioredoxin [Candidatus Gracilibacteria bacterium]